MRGSRALLSAGFLDGLAMKSILMAFGVLALAATPATATVMTLTVSGSITDGQICTSFVNCTDLTGQPYSIVYTIDDSLGARRSVPGESDILHGSNLLTPPISALAYVAGRTLASLGALDSVAYARSAAYNGTSSDDRFYGNFDENVPHCQIAAPCNRHVYETEFASEIYFTASPTDPMIFDPISGITSSSFGQIYYRNFDYNAGVYTNFLYLLANTDVQSAVFGAGSDPGTVAVPEPESWTLMTAGLIFMGLALRRRRAFATLRYGKLFSSFQGVDDALPPR
jgi:hypothetical protein